MAAGARLKRRIAGQAAGSAAPRAAPGLAGSLRPRASAAALLRNERDAARGARRRRPSALCALSARNRVGLASAPQPAESRSASDGRIPNMRR
ncbi:hypothetical protein EFP20_01075 [Burkholderia glumae]|nr:hypothetical protein CEQ24_012665 [Burkholderia glumae]UVS88883.1 hypothetical protein EFP17_03220 [Burkholderia glumae]UVT00386.1 hypothetical protein EFP20_01075 [Burkholderia glumae]